MIKSIKTNSGDLPFFYDVISNLCALVFIIDLESMEYVWGNGKYLDMFGYQEEEIYLNTNEFAENYFHPNDRYIVNERFKYFKEETKDTWSGVYRIKHKKGHWVWVHSRLMVFKYNERGKPSQLIGTILDVSDSLNTHRTIFTLIKERIIDKKQGPVSRLTPREIEIIYWISRGYTYKEMAERLCIQPDTVNKHRKNILNKLNLKNTASLINFAKETGLV
jgi:PAS domain S-box-containing protein